MKVSRGIVINVILGGVLGCLLSCIGFPPITWQFWAIMVVANAMLANGMLNS